MRKIMKATAWILVVVSILVFSSCQKEDMRTGDKIRFTARSGSAVTKAAYSGEVETSSNKERIDWQKGDTVRIFCAQAKEPANHYSDYKVASVETSSSDIAVSIASIEALGGNGLIWGSGEHTFYSVSPSPSANGIAKTISGKDVAASLPASQKVIGEITKTGKNWIASPDMKNMLMTSKATGYTHKLRTVDEVELPFTALTTAIQFTIQNDTGSALELTEVQLISSNGEENGKIISGDFNVNLDKTGIAKGYEVQPFTNNDFKVVYNQDYPECTSAALTSTNQDTDRTLSITVGTSEDPLTLAEDETFTFIFFLNPVQHFDDLTFRIVKSDGSRRSSRLGYLDGDGIFFPRHKKSFVTGLLIPEGAQWHVSFDASLIPWDNLAVGGLDLEVYSEGGLAVFISKWDEVTNGEIDFEGYSNGGAAANLSQWDDYVNDSIIMQNSK